MMTTQTIKRVPTNNVEVIVTPRNPGDFGSIYIGGKERTPKEERSVAEEIKCNIQGNVGDVGHIYVMQKEMLVTEDGVEHETLYDALEHLFSDEYFRYEYRYVRPSDNGVGSRAYAKSFPDLIEKAFQNPWDFEIHSANPPLSDQQKAFLNNVVAAGLKAKGIAAA